MFKHEAVRLAGQMIGRRPVILATLRDKAIGRYDIEYSNVRLVADRETKNVEYVEVRERTS